MNSLITVPFHQRSILVVERNGRRWVAMKPICDAIGVDWEGQRQRIKRDPILSSVACTIKATGADGKQYEMLFLDLYYLNACVEPEALLDAMGFDFSAYENSLQGSLQ